MAPTTMDIPDDLVARARRDLADVWEGTGSGHVILLALEEPALPDYSVDERMEDPEKDLEYELTSARRDLVCLRAGFCNIPSIWPLHGRRSDPISVRLQDQNHPRRRSLDSSSHHRPR